MLSAAVLSFAAASVALRRAFDGDPRLDWLAPVGLFGYAWQWGFLTFIAAAPVGLLFLVMARRQAEHPNASRGAALIALGTLCLFAHALVFLMAVALGGLLMLRACWRRGGTAAPPGLLPYAVLALAFLALRGATRGDAGAFTLDAVTYGIPLWLRPLTMLGDVTEGSGTDFPHVATLIVLMAPLGLRLPINRAGGVWVFGGLLAMLLALPFYAFETAGLVNRFALFLMPLVAILFGRSDRAPSFRDTAVTVATAAACWVSVGLSGARNLAFAEESRDFEAVLSAAPPGHRALALIADRASAATGQSQAYRHWPSWYGAEKSGFVDFNFAAFPPQVVRFRAERPSPVTTRIGWQPEAFDWSAPYARAYDEVFIRGEPSFVSEVQAAAPCPLFVVAEAGRWTLLERAACP